VLYFPLTCTDKGITKVNPKNAYPNVKPIEPKHSQPTMDEIEAKKKQELEAYRV
jgi:hypothetical protein